MVQARRLLSRRTTIAIVITVLLTGADASLAQTATAPTGGNSSAAPVPDGATETKGNPPTDPAVHLEGVTVSGPSDSDLRRYELTNKVTIDRKEIERHNDNTLSDVMRRLPGVTISPSDGIRFRGLGTGYVQILVDGVPVPNDFSIDSIAPELIERIEILPTAVAEYSTKAIAGTINIVLRKNSRSTQRTVKLGASRDGGAWYPTATLLLSEKLDGYSWSLNGTATRPRNRVITHIVDREFDDADRLTTLRDTRETYDGTTKTFNLAPRVAWTFSNGDSLTLQSLVQHSDENWSRLRRESVIVGGPSDYPHNLWLNDARVWSGRTDADWQHKFVDGSKLSARVGFNYLNRSTIFDFIGYDPADVYQLDRNIASNAIDRNFTSTGKYLTQLGSSHSLAFGWDGAYTSRGESRLQHDLNSNGAVIDTIDEDYHADVKRIAFYGQDEWEGTSTLHGYLGLRWEGLYTHVEGRTISSLSNGESVLSPIAQLVWNVPGSEKDQVRFGVARTFSAPEPRLLVPRRYTVNDSNGPTNPDIQGNPDLRPEIAWGFDTAYEHYFGDGAMVSLSGYMRRVRDVTVNHLFEQDGVWISTPVNAGRAKTQGLTLETKFALKDFWDTAIDIQFHGNVTRNWSTVDSVPGPSNHLATQIPVSGTVGMEWRPCEKLSTGWDYSYAGGSFSRVSEYWSRGTWPERKLDLYANLTLGRRDKVSLSISNVLQQHEGVYSSYHDANGSSTRLYDIGSYTGLKLQFEHQL